MPFFTHSKAKTALLVIDMQDKVFASVDRGPETLHTSLKVIKGFQTLSLPIFISEQYPQGLGSTILPLKTVLGDEYRPWIKTSFSCMRNEPFHLYVSNSSIEQWVLIGIEAHICVLQTAKDLLQAGKKVTILNDAIASRSIFDYSTAIAEMRDAGARISSCETVLFELLQDAKAPEFKAISQLVKSAPC
ncbi:MAG: isochorismatase family protein [Parachlamydiaceae bacterium]|nr:isochorismatase family protein [Parachlamydiaceae bacterium]